MLVHIFHQTDKIPGAIESGRYIFFVILTKSLVLSSRVGTSFSSYWQIPWCYRVGWIHLFIILTKSLVLSSRVGTCTCFSSDWQNPWCYRVGWVHVFHQTDRIPGAIELGGYHTDAQHLPCSANFQKCKLIDWIVFYVVSGIFQPYNGGKNVEIPTTSYVLVILLLF